MPYFNAYFVTNSRNARVQFLDDAYTIIGAWQWGTWVGKNPAKGVRGFVEFDNQEFEMLSDEPNASEFIFSDLIIDGPDSRAHVVIRAADGKSARLIGVNYIDTPHGDREEGVIEMRPGLRSNQQIIPAVVDGVLTHTIRDVAS